MNQKNINFILATDCGSTTTKAILIQKQKDGYRLVSRGEAPTTVESPVEDVTQGIINSVRELEDLTGRQLLEGNKLIKPATANKGIDLYVSTSSAGGGLQMLVTGLVKKMSAKSATRAAYGAGAIVMDVMSLDDGRPMYTQIEEIREERPDMVLLAGGTNDGRNPQVVDLAIRLAAASPSPRLDHTFKLPIIYAGNKNMGEEVKKVLEDKFELKIVGNLRPKLETENLGPTRSKIQEQFLEHVMSQAPGYDKLMAWVDSDVMPTPAAMGLIVQRIAKEDGINVMAVDIGGATTDVFSVFKKKTKNTNYNDSNYGQETGTEYVYTRTVSANYGMSYSISNVLKDASLEKILSRIPDELEVDPALLSNQIKNKMIRPTTIPQNLDDLIIEQAIAKEALRLSIEQHKELASELSGVTQQRTIADTFDQKSGGQSLVDLMKLDLIVGSGGVLSHAPSRNQTAMMLIDSFYPEGITILAVDSIFMMPHLGVLSEVHTKAAVDVFNKDCRINLGTCIAPVGRARYGDECLTIKYQGQELRVKYGEIKLIELPVNQQKEMYLKPTRKFDLGLGKGKDITAKIEGGVVGVILDCRGRPFSYPKDHKLHNAKLKEWYEEMRLYKR